MTNELLLTDGERLLRRILECPEDDAPRLIEEGKEMSSQGFLNQDKFHRMIVFFDLQKKCKPIDGFPEYAVTVDGRVFSCRWCAYKRNQEFRELKHTVSKYGYHGFCLHNGVKPKLVNAHRLVALAFIGPPPSPKSVVRHLDGNPANNDVSNLAWGTQRDNILDCIRHGRTLKGTKSPNAKLNDKRAKIIKDLVDEGFSTRCVAEFFGISKSGVERIADGEAWSHV